MFQFVKYKTMIARYKFSLNYITEVLYEKYVNYLI